MGGAPTSSSPRAPGDLATPLAAGSRGELYVSGFILPARACAGRSDVSSFPILSDNEWIMVIKVSRSSTGTSLTTDILEPLVS